MATLPFCFGKLSFPLISLFSFLFCHHLSSTFSPPCFVSLMSVPLRGSRLFLFLAAVCSFHFHGVSIPLLGPSLFLLGPLLNNWV
ncbi:uncharacterized protein BYT42DRAFT_556333 [Radiomyces spectabilis]|uniref:uncharacterized protein n=1 Tax=Radiomyces spectabilis TaxID=64574 RepID=UPI00221EB078|nr:uncharacterized protein BYT42DRAFT_556333 [Radiomyces spectabilis]KAI8391291.1 hypothetical protein BYT42DRAFT_556333 [Radiomyces spectabilis]